MKTLDDKPKPAEARCAACRNETSETTLGADLPASPGRPGRPVGGQAPGLSDPLSHKNSERDSRPASGRINCPVEATLGLIGGKYKALILWKLAGQTLRFSQLRRVVPRATPKMLTQQLRELENDGLIRREVYPVIPPKVEYSLTEFGASIRPVLESMYAWGSGYLQRQGLAVNCSMRPFERAAAGE